MRKILWLALAAFLLIGSMSVAAEKVITVGMSQEPDGWGPMFSMVAGTQVEFAMNAGIMIRSNDWELHPGYAKYRPNPEDGTWEVNEEEGTMVLHWKFREDLYWHDGTQFTIHDYLFGHEVTLDERVPIIARANARNIEHVEIISDFEAKVYWKELYPFADLTFVGADPMPRHILEDVYRENVERFVNNAYWTTGFVGLGPYKMVEWVPGSHIELERNPNYFLGEPKIDRIYFRFIEDLETLRVMMLTGDLDATIQPTIDLDAGLSLARDADPAELQVEFLPSTVWEHIDFNTRDNEHLQNPNVRKALLHALDRQEISDTLFNGLFEISHLPYPNRHPLYTEEADAVVTQYEYNPERARALLAAAGYGPDRDGIMTHVETGEKLILNFRTTSGNQPRELMQQIMADYWGQIGVKIEIDNRSAGALFDPVHFYRREWPGMILFAWVFYPTSLPNYLLHSEWIPAEETGWSGQNMSGWANEQADELIDKIMMEMSETQRQKYAVDLFRIWSEELPSLPLFYRTDVTAFKPSITGILPTATADPDTWNIHLWDIN